MHHITIAIWRKGILLKVYRGSVESHKRIALLDDINAWAKQRKLTVRVSLVLA